MVKSGSWEWDKVIQDYWKEPADDVYYLAFRWSRDNKKRILDLGCGIGRHAIFFAEKGFLVDAVDLSESGISRLRRLVEKKELPVNTDVVDMLSLPYASDSFDCLLAFHVIYHTDKKGIEQIISEINRVLVKNGEVYLTFISKSHPSFNDPNNEWVDENTRIKAEEEGSRITHYYVDEKEIRRLMSEFEIIRFIHTEKIMEAKRSCHYFVLAKKGLHKTCYEPKNIV